MNLPNKLTLSRILIIPFFVLFLLISDVTNNPGQVVIFRLMALLLFIYAGVSDLVDGYIARKYNLVTNFGRLFDPLADKLINASAFVCFVELNLFPAWIVVLILSREFLITGLRSLGTIQGRVIHASRWGKHKTLWQVVTILAALIFLCLRDLLSLNDVWLSLRIMDVSVDLICKAVLRLLIYICAFFTLFSGVMYFIKNIDLIRDET